MADDSHLWRPAEVAAEFQEGDMKRRFTAAFACAALLAAPAVGAQSRCPAGDSGCTLENAPDRIKERVDEGAKKVLNDSNEQGRWKEVKDTVKDCIKCGMDAVKDGIDQVTGKDKDPPE